MKQLKDIGCYILDMDGTIYLGEQVIPGAQKFLTLLTRLRIPYYFFTNNSSKSPDDYINKLKRLNLGNYERSHIITSFDVAADYIRKTYGCSACVYTVGTPSMEQQMSAEGFITSENGRPDCVLVGFDTTFNFEKASRAVDYLRDGVPFLATNIDAVCPLEGGKVLPDCASICAMLTHATGCEPKYLGKPFAETAAYIAGHTGVSVENTAVIGDRLYTDMMLATKNGMCAIGVLSGEMTRKDINNSTDKPHFIFDSVLELHEALLNDLRS